MKHPPTISSYKSPTNRLSINGFQLLSITQLFCLVFKHNDRCALLGLMRDFAVGWADRGGRYEGWGYDEWLWFGRWVGFGVGVGCLVLG